MLSLMKMGSMQHLNFDFLYLNLLVVDRDSSYDYWCIR